ncbi:MAG TPA: protein kinase, partial [Thermoanaerobaculia bacterium]|nr:protein kinase [Thermoanaerobaculia bacterium]
MWDETRVEDATDLGDRDRDRDTWTTATEDPNATVPFLSSHGREPQPAGEAPAAENPVQRYRILGPLGEGGMGVVYRAEDTRLRRKVAFKTVPAELAANRRAKERFLNEARAASALDHPNVCTVFEIEETGEGPVYLTMPCYDGETL